MNAFVEGLITIALAIVGLGVVSVVLSKNANTAGVIQASASALGNDIATAQGPVTGNNPTINLNYPGESNGFGN